MDLVLLCRANRGEPVNLVEEDDRGLACARFFEKQAQLAFGLADPLREAVCAFAHEEGCGGESG
jgi:hypothetical protein